MNILRADIFSIIKFITLMIQSIDTVKSMNQKFKHFFSLEFFLALNKIHLCMFPSIILIGVE